MKMNFFKLLIVILLPLTIAGCVSKPKQQVTLPPTPQRKELNQAKTVEDLVNMINYYEHLVQEWEQWGEDVQKIIK